MLPSLSLRKKKAEEFMFKEMWTYMTTPCETAYRKMGYVHGMIGLVSRHGRCAKAWAPHLEASKDLIRQAIAQTKKKRQAVILGAGPLYDVPVKDLAEAFDEVILVDIVLSTAAKKAAKRYRSVKTMVVDVSGLAEAAKDAADKGGPLPKPVPPREFKKADLVVSLSILSQLPIRPRGLLIMSKKYDLPDLDAFAGRIVKSHLTWLQGLRGTVCLISDVQRLEVDGDEILEDEDPWFGVPKPDGGTLWDWDVAPRPELRKDRDVVHKVRGWIWERQ